MSQRASTTKIAIGLCTYKRAALLETCLQSIAQLARPDGVELCVLIADNDPEGSARPVVDACKKSIDIPVHYGIEQRRGIPFARNSVLEKARQLGVTELAFVDDDEYMDAMWLVNLWTFYINSDADVVRGFVKTVYPPCTPAWIIKGSIYQRPRPQTGRSYAWAATNNVLFNFKKIVIEQGLLFDNTFSLTGGSDADFFRRAHAKGSIIRFVANAVVYEVLASNRMALSYFLRRKWREQNQLSPSLPHGRKRIQLIYKESKLLFQAGFFLIRNVFNGRHVIAKRLGEVVVRVAKISALLGIYIKWNEYK